MFSQKFLNKRAQAHRAPIVSPQQQKFIRRYRGAQFADASIDLDPFDLTIEEKIFRGAKRICIIFAIAAVTLSALDLMNIRSVETAAEFIHGDRAAHRRSAEL